MKAGWRDTATPRIAGATGPRATYAPATPTATSPIAMLRAMVPKFADAANLMSARGTWGAAAAKESVAEVV